MEGDGIRERDLPQDGEPTCWDNVEVFPIFNFSDSGATSAPLAASPASQTTAPVATTVSTIMGFGST
jgi:hypothetical protein